MQKKTYKCARGSFCETVQEATFSENNRQSDTLLFFPRNTINVLLADFEQLLVYFRKGIGGFFPLWPISLRAELEK